MCSTWDAHGQPTFHFIWVLNATILILMKRPMIILCLVIGRYCRNHDISSKYYDECNFLVHFAWPVLRLTLSTRKTLVFQGYVGSLFAQNIFVNIWCALVSRHSYLKKNSYHIWMNHCEHKIHHLTTTFCRNISYFVAYMWCSHRRLNKCRFAGVKCIYTI